jgi:hypothetical protein
MIRTSIGTGRIITRVEAIESPFMAYMGKLVGLNLVHWGIFYRGANT